MSTSERIPPSVRDGLRWLLGAGGAIVLVVLLARTAVGATHPSLAAWLVALLSACGFAVAMTTWRVDDVFRSSGPWEPRLMRAVAAWLAGLLFGLLIAGPGPANTASVVAVGLTWAAAIAVRLWQSTEKRRREPETTGVAGVGVPARQDDTLDAVVATEPLVIGADSATICATSPAPEAGLPENLGGNPSLCMQLRRSTTSAGEQIEIQARLEFAAGAREAILHVPFWPALSAPPEVECEPLGEDEVDLRVTAAERYGLRIEGRLPAATTESLSLWIGVEVRATANSSGISAAA